MTTLEVPEELIDRHENNILDVEENLTQGEIVRISNKFKHMIDFENAPQERIANVSSYIQEHVANKQLKAILSDQINVFRAIPEAAQVLAPSKQEILIKRDIDPRSGVPIGQAKLFVPKQSDIELNNELRNKFDKHVERNQEIFDLDEKNEDFSLDDVDETMKNQFKENLINSFDELDIFMERLFNENIIDEDTKAEYLFNRDKIFDKNDDLDIDEFEENDTVYRFNVKLLKRRLIRGFRGARREIAIEPIRSVSLVPSGLPNTKENMKEFTKALNAELEAIKRKDFQFINIQKKKENGIAVHQPHDVHVIGNIKILSDKFNNVKEIIIEQKATGQDILNLASALIKEDGILVDLQGNKIIDIHSKNKNVKIIADLLIKLMSKLLPGDSLRLLYKPVNEAIGGQFIGGVFTDIFYNNPKLKHVAFKNQVKGGFIGSRDFGINHRHDFLRFPIQT